MGCRVEICCCGCSLRTGTLIIGWLALIGETLETISAIYSAIETHYAMYWGVFASSLLGILLALCLIVGANTRRPSLLWVWVIVSTILMLLELILSIVGVVIAKAYYFIAIVAVGLLLQVYFIVVVRSYALQLQECGPEVCIAPSDPYQALGAPEYQASVYQSTGYHGSVVTGYPDIKPYV